MDVKTLRRINKNFLNVDRRLRACLHEVVKPFLLLVLLRLLWNNLTVSLPIELIADKEEKDLGTTLDLDLL